MTPRTTHPVVSVIMPSYNNQDVIGNAIESVLSQTMDSWELIIIDDGSTDSTVDFVKSTYKDNRISIYSMEKNSGSGACRNVAISKAKGRYIAVLDADDECLPHRLEKQVEAFAQYPDAAVIASQVLEFGSWGGPISGTWPTIEADVRKRQQMGKMPVAHPSVMFERNALLEAGCYDTACIRAQDYALFLRLTNKRIVCLSEPLVKYRTNRPTSFRYVFRNEVYADLAKRRHQALQSGAGTNNLPLDATLRLSILIKAVRSWLIRNSRDYRHSRIGRLLNIFNSNHHN